MRKTKNVNAKKPHRVSGQAHVTHYYVGLDVALKQTQVCVLDNVGQLVCDQVVASRPAALSKILKKFCGTAVERIAIESGNYSGWLCQELKKEGWPVVCLDALQVSRFLSVRRNKTDSNDARGLAELVRHGLDWVREVHVKTPACYEIRNLLTMRGHIVKQRVENEIVLRGLLKAYGCLLRGQGNTVSFRQRVLKAIETVPDHDTQLLKERFTPLLDLIDDLKKRADTMETELRLRAEADPVCQRFMAIPGVGPIVALSFYTAIENPKRFRRSEDVGAYFGLTPRIYQSGEIDNKGAISHMGNAMTRMHLVQAANCILSSTKSWSTLKAWGIRLSKKSGYNKAKVAVARKLAVLMFAMWRDNTPFCYGQEALRQIAP